MEGYDCVKSAQSKTCWFSLAPVMQMYDIFVPQTQIGLRMYKLSWIYQSSQRPIWDNAVWERSLRTDFLKKNIMSSVLSLWMWSREWDRALQSRLCCCVFSRVCAIEMQSHLLHLCLILSGNLLGNPSGVCTRKTSSNPLVPAPFARLST